MNKKLIIIKLSLLLLMSCTSTTQSIQNNRALLAIETKKLLYSLFNKTKVVFKAIDNEKAHKILENNYTLQSSSWVSGLQKISITPLKTFEKEKGVYCRKYQSSLMDSRQSINESIKVIDTACRKNGQWERIVLSGKY